MKHVTKKMGMMLLAFVMMCTCVMGDLTYAQAASVKKQAGKAYAEILNQYLQVNKEVKNNASWEDDDVSYPNVNLEYLVECRHEDTIPVYRIFDYNGDGTPELFIGVKWDQKAATIYDVYTFHKGKAVQLMEGIGWRNGSCRFRKNGIIEDCFNQGAFFYGLCYHKMPKEKKQLSAVVVIYAESDLQKNTWKKVVNGNETVISEKEALAIQKKYGKSQAYTFCQLTGTAVKNVRNGKFTYSGQKNWRITDWG